MTAADWFFVAALVTVLIGITLVVAHGLGKFGGGDAVRKKYELAQEERNREVRDYWARRRAEEKAFGARAFRAGASADANPHDRGNSTLSVPWLEGWPEAAEEAKEKAK